MVAHRGSSGTAPENTIAAFTEAVEAGADMIELDVRLTRDREVVVLHDRSVRRTTGGSGHVWAYTFEELRALDAGSWFAPRFRGERIPALREVLDLLPAHIGIDIEIKADGDPRPRLAIEHACILAIRERGCERRVVITSFNHRCIRRLHHLDPGIRTGLLAMPGRDMGRKPSTLARASGSSLFVCSRRQLRKRFVRDAHEHAISVACYTIDTLEQLAAARRFGVDAIITNFPARITRLLRDRR